MNFRPGIDIALCGYEGEHDMPTSWDCVEWKARGGYGSACPDRSVRGEAMIYILSGLAAQ